MMKLAGATFPEPEEGALRVVVGDVGEYINSEIGFEIVFVKGLLVQKYKGDDDGYSFAWTTVCPLVDAYYFLNSCPIPSENASRRLTDMRENGEETTLEIEIAALNKAYGK